MSAINLPIYLPPEPYSLEIVITICLSVVLLCLISSFTISFTFAFIFNPLTSFIKNIAANINANPSATGPALKTPIIPNIWLSIIIDGINITICLESDNIALFVLFPIAWKNIPDGICTPFTIVNIKYVLNAKQANSI